MDNTEHTNGDYAIHTAYEYLNSVGSAGGCFEWYADYVKENHADWLEEMSTSMLNGVRDGMPPALAMEFNALGTDKRASLGEKMVMEILRRAWDEISSNTSTMRQNNVLMALMEKRMVTGDETVRELVDDDEYRTIMGDNPDVINCPLIFDNGDTECDNGTIIAKKTGELRTPPVAFDDCYGSTHGDGFMAGMIDGNQFMAWTSTYEHTHPDDMKPDVVKKLAKAMKLIMKLEAEATVMGKPWRKWLEMRKGAA